MMGLATLSPRVLLELAAAVAIAAALWFGYSWVHARGAESVQIKWDAEKRDQAEQSAKVAADALATTKSLSATLDKQRSTTNAQISALNNSLAAAVAGLRERPARDSAGSVPRDPATGAAIGATGADLFRQDGEFLARESARADTLRLRLTECQAAYSAAREALK